MLGKCVDKLGLVPNVLRAYTGNPLQFRTFTAFYNQLMLDEETTQLSKLEREMIALVSLCGQSLLLPPGGARPSGAPAVLRSAAGRDDGDELPGGRARRAHPRYSRLRLEADTLATTSASRIGSACAIFAG